MYANLENKLHALGLTSWHPRAFKHPKLASASTLIDAQPFRINPKCLVILFFPYLTVKPIDPIEQKILTGMLGVLELHPEQLMQVHVYSENPDLIQVQQYIQRCAPFTVLQLNMGVPQININTHYIRTYSPAHLQANVQDKAQAYKDLLKLRNILHHVAS